MTLAEAHASAAQRSRKPNYQQIHAQPLPVKAYALPPLIPNNPLSLLHIAYTILAQYLFPPPSHEDPPCKGSWSPETRSVHVTDPKSIRILWEQGFFGKGSLSRSEPTWLQTENARRGKADKQTSEALTAQRREERRRMKNERAVKAQEAIEETRKLETKRSNHQSSLNDQQDKENRAPIENGSTTPSVTNTPLQEPATIAKDSSPGFDKGSSLQAKRHDVHDVVANGDPATILPGPAEPKPRKPRPPPPTLTAKDLQSDFFSRVEALRPTSDTPNQQEHLQLTPTEAFFLCYALGSLDIYPLPTNTAGTPSSPLLSPTPTPYTPSQLLHRFLSSSSFTPFVPRPSIFPSTSSNTWLRPDDPFLLTYITYHHFRSLGWTPRPGLKFGCDFLLYPNGPAIEHAPFGVVILADYVRDPWWRSTEERRRYVAGKERKRTWQWWHAVNRVQGQVKKGVVVCWVEVPGVESVGKCLSGKEGEAVDVGRLLGMYRVRELVCKRWSPNRGRD